MRTVRSSAVMVPGSSSSLRPPVQPRKPARSRPSPTGRMVAVKRGSRMTAALNARSASVPSPGPVGRSPETRPAHRTLSAMTSAPGTSRGTIASRYAPYSCLSASTNTRSNGPARAGSDAAAANASRAGRLTTTIRASGIPACCHQPRARSVLERSGSIVTIDPDRSRTERARGWWQQAGIPDARIVVVNRPALDAFAAAASEPALAGPFDLAFVDALKHEYGAYLEAIVPRLVPGALVIADNVLWAGRVSGERPSSQGDGTDALRAVNAAVMRDSRFTATILPVGATIEDAWSALAAQVPAIASARPFVRFARNGAYADADTPLADGDEVACIPPISGGAGEEDAAGDDPVIRRFELRADPFPATFAREPV